MSVLKIWNGSAWVQIDTIKGEQGIQGATGPTGPKGDNGDKGDAGASITEAEFDGDDILFTLDDASTVRIVGGKTAVTGADGQPGQDGANGTNGADGDTPVRGTDYWTAEDIAAIEADVDDSIQDALADYVAVSDVADVFACDIDSKKAVNFSFTIADTDAKEITFTNEPANRCEVFLEITTSAAPGAITWTLNSGSTLAWSTGSAPTLTSTKVYRIMFITSDSGSTWDAYPASGVA